ncbi:MAG: hypothetical protein ACP59X_02485 [Solidesulfovibrio sp. DCME]|uniref:hypothetical protein n=1 Tax=Solidesulfovibrio sp. DCME TaxID=3447380 RepID=UPI003D142212
MAGGISDIYFTSLRLAKGESVAAASPAPRLRLPGGGTAGSDAGSTGATLVDSLTAGLDTRLARFEKALSRFAWPTDAASGFNGRLVVRDAGLTGRLDAATVETGQAVNPNKFFSDGKSAIAASGIPAGTYRFAVSQGEASEDFSVTVGRNDTWGTVLGKVAKAVNGSTALSVRASVARQQAPFGLDPSLPGTGTVLALSVNPLRREQDVAVADEKGDLLSRLGVAAAANVASAATPSVYEVSVDRLAQPTYFHSTAYDPGAVTTLAAGLHHFSVATGTGTQAASYVSDAFDPEAATTLSPGTYTFTAGIGQASRQLSVTVKSGWTWGDVLNAVTAKINGSQASVWASGGTATELVGTSGFSLPGVKAASQTVAVPAASGSGAATAGRVLTVATTSGFEDQDLRLTDGAGGLLAALGLDTRYTGQVVSVGVSAADTWRDVLGNVSRGVAMATGRVEAGTVQKEIASYAVPQTRLPMLSDTATMVLVNRRLGESLTLTDGSSGLLHSLGLDTSLPGQDGQITVNGQAFASENNAYSLQSGRLLLEAQNDTGGDLPLAVTRSMDAVSERLGSVVEAYNDLRKYLLANSDAFSSTLADSLAGPVAANWPGLAAMGFAKTRKADMLWVSSAAFWRAFYNNADTSRQTLAEAPSGLIPAWKSTVAGIKAAGTAVYLTPETAHLSRVAVRRTAADLERTNWLVDWRG